jgi:hypothetical protein
MDPVTLRDQDLTKENKKVERMMAAFHQRMSRRPSQKKLFADSDNGSSGEDELDASSSDEDMPDGMRNTDKKHHTQYHGDEVCG